MMHDNQIIKTIESIEKEYSSEMERHRDEMLELELRIAKRLSRLIVAIELGNDQMMNDMAKEKESVKEVANGNSSNR